MSRDLNKDIFGWDTANWSHAIAYWNKFLPQVTHETKALELGSGFNGGLSLWLASQGIKTVCSGYNDQYVDASDAAKATHKKYKIDTLIEYKRISALDICYENEFDIIVYKSMLGGIVRHNDLIVGSQVIDQIFTALKPGGVLLFAENIYGTRFHQLARSKFGSGRDAWRYFTINEMKELHSQFKSFEYKTHGFLGCFGPNEKTRLLLGQIDQLCSTLIPDSYKYIFFGAAKKSETPQ